MKTALGIAATLLALVAYVPYVRNMLAGRTRPHAFAGQVAEEVRRGSTPPPWSS